MSHKMRLLPSYHTNLHRIECCKDVHTLHRGGKYIQESEIKGNLPDEVVDEDLISL